MDEGHIIVVSEADGAEHRLDALDGWRLMEIMRDHGLPVPHECDGSGVCGKCRVDIDPAWSNALVPARDDELDLLDADASATDASRLSCQVLYHPGLNGLRLSLPERQSVPETVDA